MFLDLYEHLVEGEKPNPDDIFQSASQDEVESRQPEILQKIKAKFGGVFRTMGTLVYVKLSSEQFHEYSFYTFLQSLGYTLKFEDSLESVWWRHSTGEEITFYPHSGQVYYYKG